MKPNRPAAAAIFRGLPGPLLAWYARSAREMPWRTPCPDPYRTLVSEIMLQQTRVETVKPYFLRFGETLPDFAALAAADEDLLLKLWEGLGYYSRVRNLQKAARAVMDGHGGKLPGDPKALRQLPGIGEYTAGALASIVFGLPEPAVDGNVLRVCARLLDCHDDTSDPAFRAGVTDRLRSVYPVGKCSEFTQSLMDLGAVVCIPGTPHCAECPLKTLCLGFLAGTADALPVRKKAPPRRIERKTVFLVVSRSGRTAIRKRPAGGVLAGLWEYPAEDGTFSKKEAAAWLERHGLAPETLRKCPPWKHVFTHLEWHLSGWRAEGTDEPPGFGWASQEELRSVYSVPGAFKGIEKA